MTMQTPIDGSSVPLPARAGRWLWGQAYLLLTLTCLMWAGNAVASKYAVGEVSPMTLTCLRWIISCSALAIVARRKVQAEWRLLKPAWLSIILMGTFGFTGFNALFYEAARYTTAINLTLIQGAIPVLVLIGSFLLWNVRITWLQIMGVVATLAGVVLASTHGDVTVLRTLAFNIGDIWTLIACTFYAGYTLALRGRPRVSGIVFFSAMAGAALITSIPLLIAEIMAGGFYWPSPIGIAVILYVGLLPSLVSQIFFMRGVELIGPNRAGLFVNFVPVFGALMAVVFLGEPFAPYHAVAFTLVLGGIWVAERLRRPALT